MYNTLKEIQDALSDKQLYMYADKAEGKTPEEVVEMFKTDNIDISIEAAKEGIDYLKGVEIVSDEELENVAGGTCYSSGTYEELGIEPADTCGILPWHHPVITTLLNHCGLDCHSTCSACDFHHTIGPTVYCTKRSKEFDPTLNF